MSDDTTRTVYARMVGGGATRRVRKVVLECPIGEIPPPTLRVHGHTYAYVGVGTQAEIARVYGVSQQTAGKWLRGGVK